MRWIVDEEGDIGISFWNVFTLVKYKDSVIFRWGGKSFKNADKFQGAV